MFKKRILAYMLCTIKKKLLKNCCAMYNHIATLYYSRHFPSDPYF